MPTMPSIGANALGAQFEHKVSGWRSQASSSLIVPSFRRARTAGSACTDRFGAI